MAVFQPLYYAYGRYTADLDRNLLTALIDPGADKVRHGGVIPPETSMQVSITSASSRTLSISTGMCVVPDSSSPSGDSPGLYLAGVDASAESITVDSTSGTYYVYANVDGSEGYIVDTKAIDTSTDIVTLVTTAAHGFTAGETVVISGIDSTFDGIYTLTSGTTGTTIKYSRTYSGSTVSTTSIEATVRINATTYNISAASLSSNQVTLTTATLPTYTVGANNTVTVTGVSPIFDGIYQGVWTTGGTSLTYYRVSDDQSISPTNSSVARARVPFAIRSATSIPSGSYLLLASVTVSGGVISGAVTDMRRFASAVGGVTIWNSNTGASWPSASNGKLKFDTYTNKLEIYDSTHGYVPIYNNGDWSHVLGATSTTAAAGDHTHYSLSESAYSSSASTAGLRHYTVSSITSTANATTMTATSAGAGFTAPSSGRVLVVFRGRLRTTTSGDYSALGLAIREGTTTVGGGSPFTNSDGVAYGAFSSYDDMKSVSLIGSDADSGDAYVGMGTSYMVWGLTGGSAYNAIFYHANSDTVNLTITNVMLQIIPMP